MPALKDVFADQLAREEARAELLSCLIFGGSLGFLFAGLSFVEQARTMPIFSTLGWVLLGYLALLATLAAFVRSGRWHSSLSYLNTGLQIVVLSYFLGMVSVQKDPTFALSTALPMIYCLGDQPDGVSLETRAEHLCRCLRGSVDRDRVRAGDAAADRAGIVGDEPYA